MSSTTQHDLPLSTYFAALEGDGEAWTVEEAPVVEGRPYVLAAVPLLLSLTIERIPSWYLRNGESCAFTRG